MSGEAMRWAWKQKVKPSSAKLALLCLANCHNGSTGQCNPSTSYISTSTGLDAKTVPSATKRLAEVGLIDIHKQSGKSPRYNLNLHQNWETPQTPESSKNRAANLHQKRVSPKTGVHQKRGTPKTDVTSTKNGETPPPKLEDEPVKNHKNHLKYKGLDLSKIPNNLHPNFREFIDHRKNLRKPLTQEALDRAFAATGKASIELGWTGEEVIQKTIDAGWQGVNTEWLRNRYCKNQAPAGGAARGPQGSSRQTTLQEDLTDTSWAN